MPNTLKLPIIGPVDLSEHHQTPSPEFVALNEHAIVARTDAAGSINYVNDKFCEISGYSREELLGQNHRILNSGHHHPSFFTGMWKHITQGRSWRSDVRNRAKDGTLYWVDTTIAPIIRNGRIEGYLSFRYDITKERNAQKITQEVSELRARYISLSKNRPDFFRDVIQRVLSITGCEFGYVTLFQESGSKVIFKSHFAADENDSECLKAHFSGPDDECVKEVLSGKPYFNSKLGAVDLCERGFPKCTMNQLFFMGLPVIFKGKTIALIGLYGAPSGRELHVELAPLLDVIGGMIHSMELEDEILQQTLIMEHNSKLATIGKLAAGVGHEINNPLTIVQGLLSITEMELNELGSLTPSVKEKYERIEIALSRIGTIVKGLRSLSRVDGLQLAPFNLYELLEETFKLVKDVYLRAGIEISFESETTNCFVNGSRGRLQQVLINLISNARDAVEFRPSKTIKMRLYSDSNHHFVSIEDTGAGVPQEIREKIFEPFFTTKDANRGTGIGLSMVNTIIKEHQGEITFSSEVNQGTTFCISLPQFSHTIIKQNLQKPQEHWAGLKVLLVDDEAELCEILQHTLKRLGVESEMAFRADKALQMLETYSFDLIISDINMPGLDGFEFLGLLRGSRRLQKQPRFLLTSGSMDLTPEKVKVISTDTDGLLPKPFNLQLITQKLRELFPDYLNKTK